MKPGIFICVAIAKLHSDVYDGFFVSGFRFRGKGKSMDQGFSE
jgi:hypothetical protein